MVLCWARAPTTRGPEARRERGGPGIAEIIDATRREADVVRVGLVRARDLRVQARIAGNQKQVVGRHVEAGAPSRARPHPVIVIVFNTHVLTNVVRSALHPTGIDYLLHVPWQRARGD